MKMRMGIVGVLSTCLYSFLFAQPTNNPMPETAPNHPATVTVASPVALAPAPVQHPTANNAMIPMTNTPATTQPAAPANGVLTQDKPIYSLRLNSNPTTGYSWFLVSYPSNLLTVVQHQYIAPTNQMPGAGGVEVWQFQANADAFNVPRVLKIVMMYARPWEINDQTPTQSFYIVTQ